MYHALGTEVVELVTLLGVGGGIERGVSPAEEVEGVAGVVGGV